MRESVLKMGAIMSLFFFDAPLSARAFGKIAPVWCIDSADGDCDSGGLVVGADTIAMIASALANGTAMTSAAANDFCGIQSVYLNRRICSTLARFGIDAENNPLKRRCL